MQVYFGKSILMMNIVAKLGKNINTNKDILEW